MTDTPSGRAATSSTVGGCTWATIVAPGECGGRVGDHRRAGRADSRRPRSGRPRRHRTRPPPRPRSWPAWPPPRGRSPRDPPRARLLEDSEFHGQRYTGKWGTPPTGGPELRARRPDRCDRDGTLRAAGPSPGPTPCPGARPRSARSVRVGRIKRFRGRPRPGRRPGRRRHRPRRPDRHRARTRGRPGRRPGRPPGRSAGSSVRISVRENWGTSGPPASEAACSPDIGRAKKNPWAASASNERTISTWAAVSTCSTMADMPSEWAMWMTVSTTSRLIPWVDSRPAMNEPSILTVLMEWRLNGSNDDQLVPTSSTDSCTPIWQRALRSAGGRRVDDGVLGDLEGQLAAREPGLLQGGGHGLGHLAPPELVDGAVDAQLDARRPAAGLLAGLHHDPAGQRPDVATGLGLRDQLVGRDDDPGSGAASAPGPPSRAVGRSRGRRRAGTPGRATRPGRRSEPVSVSMGRHVPAPGSPLPPLSTPTRAGNCPCT